MSQFVLVFVQFLDDKVIVFPQAVIQKVYAQINKPFFRFCYCSCVEQKKLNLCALDEH